MPHLIVSLPRKASASIRQALVDLAEQARLSVAGDSEADGSVFVVPHLYDLTEGDPAIETLAALPSDESYVVLAAMYPRAAYWTLRAHGCCWPPDRVTMIDIRPLLSTTAADETQELASEALDRERLQEVVAAAITAQTRSDSQLPTPDSLTETTILEGQSQPSRWYPVIDTDRCIGCLECLNFCLFGVYGIGEDNVPVVEQPDACRDGCPACSRICPAQAILFPECNESHIAGKDQDEAESKSLANDNSTDVADNGIEQAAAQAEREQHKRTSGKGLDSLVDDIEAMDL